MIKLLHIIKATAVVGLLLLSTSAFAQRIYVKTDGVPYSSIAEHADWNVATHDLQAAINAIAAEEGGGEVWVAKGIYFPTEIFNGDASDNRNKSFILKNNVRVVGGFAGTETDEGQRTNYTYDTTESTYGENATILDGDLGSERSYHVVFLGNLSDETAVLEDVIIRNGIANAASTEVGFEDSNYFGGGIYARNGGAFDGCTIIDNRGGLGGGAYCVSATFNNCTFVNNRGWYSSSEYNGKGGGLFVHEESLITNCEFIGNLADNDGGGIYSSGSSFTNITFSGNTAGNNGGAICTYADGATYNGGVYTTCTFTGNSADGNGGAIYALPGGGSFDDCMISENNANRGGGVYLNTGATLSESTIFENTVVTSHAGVYNVGGLIEGCTIENNNGTGVFLDGGVAKNTIIKGNYGASTGAGVLMSGAAELNTCLVYDNESERGGGVYANDGALIINSLINNNTAELSGGGLYINGVVAVINTTVTRNKVLSVTGLGQGVLCNAPSTPSGSGEFVNSIICSNEGSNPSSTEIDYAPDVTATFQYTAVEGIANSGDGNVELDPSAEVFVMPTTFAGAASSPEEEAEFETADWRLNLLSPCFNGGTPDITGLDLPENDLLGNGRVYKTRVDMGAIENVYYDVTIASTGLGATSPATDLSVLPGDDLEIIMIPVEGNGVSDVVVNSESVYDQMIDNGDGTFSYTISAIGEDKAVNVTFLPYYTVTATAGDGGSISPLTSVILEGRSSDEFTITPDAGYKLTSLQLGGEEVQWEDNAGVLTYTVPAVAADVSLVAAFTEYFTVTATAGTGGAITPPTSEVLINESSDEFTITPDAGYKLTSLQLGGEEVQWEDNAGVLTYTVTTVTTDVSLVAAFTEYFTVTATAGTGGAITPPTSEVLINESSDEFTITPDAGYKLTSLQLGGEEVQWEDNAGVLTYTVATVTTDVSLVAAFTQYFTVSATAGTGGAITPASSEVLINEDSDEFTITPEAGYKLTSLLLDEEEVQWEDNAGVLTYTVSAVAADASLVAGFTQYFTVTVNANDGGTVENEGANEVYINELFDIVITPDQGYTITSVTINSGDNVVGELTEDNGVYSMQLTSIAEDKNVEVTFELANSLSKTNAAKHRVYPTVTSGLVNVEGDYERIEIVSLTGNVVKQLKNDTGGQLELYDLSPGTYIVVIHSKSGRTLSKIIKK